MNKKLYLPAAMLGMALTFPFASEAGAQTQTSLNDTYSLVMAFRIDRDSSGNEISQTVLVKERVDAGPLTEDQFNAWVAAHDFTSQCLDVQYDVVDAHSISGLNEDQEVAAFKWQQWNAMEVGDKAIEGLGGVYNYAYDLNQSDHDCVIKTDDTPAPATPVVVPDVQVSAPVVLVPQDAPTAPQDAPVAVEATVVHDAPMDATAVHVATPTASLPLTGVGHVLWLVALGVLLVFLGLTLLALFFLR